MKTLCASLVLILTLGMVALTPNTAKAATAAETLYQMTIDAMGNQNSKFETVDFLLMWLD